MLVGLTPQEPLLAPTFSIYPLTNIMYMAVNDGGG